MLQPKRTKFRKAHKGRIHGNAKKPAFAPNFFKNALGDAGLDPFRPERPEPSFDFAGQRELKKCFDRRVKFDQCFFFCRFMKHTTSLIFMAYCRIYCF